jgi:hypothetical protein
VARLCRVGSLDRRRSDLGAQLIRERLECAHRALRATRARQSCDASGESIGGFDAELHPRRKALLELGGGHDQPLIFSHGATLSASATNSRAIRIERRAMKLRVRNSEGALASLDPGKEIIVFAPLESDFFVDASRIAKLFDFLRAHSSAGIFREKIVDAIERPTRLRELRDKASPRPGLPRLLRPALAGYGAEQIRRFRHKAHNSTLPRNRGHFPDSIGFNANVGAERNPMDEAPFGDTWLALGDVSARVVEKLKSEMQKPERAQTRAGRPAEPCKRVDGRAAAITAERRQSDKRSPSPRQRR